MKNFGAKKCKKCKFPIFYPLINFLHNKNSYPDTILGICKENFWDNENRWHMFVACWKTLRQKNFLTGTSLRLNFLIIMKYFNKFIIILLLKHLPWILIEFLSHWQRFLEHFMSLLQSVSLSQYSLCLFPLDTKKKFFFIF